MRLRTLLLFTLFVGLAASPAAAGIPVEGLVRGPDGKPVRGAEIGLEPILDTYGRAVLRLDDNIGPEPTTKAKPNAEGFFVLEVPEPGMWKVTVAAPGLLAMEYRLIPLVDAMALPTLEMIEQTELEVKVVDAEGKPVAAAVGVFTRNTRRRSWQPRLRLARAGDNGLARLPNNPQENLRVEVLAEGYPLAWVDNNEAEPVRIRLQVGKSGTVKVIGSQKRPVAKALVYQGSGLLPLGLTDEEGRLPLALATKDQQRIRIVTIDGWNGTFEPDFGPGPESKEERLRLEPPITVGGSVVDGDNREPVAGALVWANRGQHTVTDARGNYQLPVVGVAPRFVQAAAIGYQPGGSRRDAADSDALTSIALAPVAVVSGRVVDSEQKALAAVTIRIEPLAHAMPRSGGFGWQSSWVERSTPNGRFRISKLVAGSGYALTFEKPGFAPQRIEVNALERSEHRSGLEVVLHPGRLGIGLVVSEEDQPVAGASVELRQTPKGNELTSMMRRLRHAESESGAAHSTNAEGRFAIPDLAIGNYDLEVKASGFAPAKVPGVQVEEGVGEVDFGTVVLVAGAVIEGVVKDAEDEPVAGAKISTAVQRTLFMSSMDSSQNTTTTDKEGHFAIHDLLPGQKVNLNATKDGYGSGSAASVRAPTEEPVEIVLPLAARIIGRVVDAQGRPVAKAQLTAVVEQNVRVDSQISSARTDEDGRFELENVEPQRVRVSVDAESFQAQVVSVTVPPGGVHEVEFVLATGAVVEGTVSAADGQPIVQATVHVMAQSGGLGQVYGSSSRSARRQTDASGRYRIDGVSTGTAQLMVFQNNGKQMTKTITVEAGTNLVDIVFEGGFEVSGQVVDHEGTPVAGATLAIQQQGTVSGTFGGAAQALTKIDGTFTLTDVAPGQVVVTAHSDGFSHTSSEPIEVEGDVSGLLLELQRGATLKGRVIDLEFDELGSLSLTAFSQGASMMQGRVDFKAEYRIENLAPGMWHVQAQVGDTGRNAMLQINVPEGVTEIERDIEFGSGFTLRGVVLDSGQPLIGAQITAVGGRGTTGTSATDSTGRFVIENLQPGSYQVMVMVGASTQTVEAVEIQGDREIQIEIVTAQVSGTLVDAVDGQPIDNATVRLEALEEDALSMITQHFGNQALSDSLGRFTLPKVKEGGWRVVATKSGYAPGEATLAVAGSSPREVSIRMTPTEGVSFEVALASGSPLQMIQVAILDPSGRRLAGDAVAVVEGRAKVATVPPGQWDLLLQAGDSAAIRFPVSSPGDQGRVVLPRGGSLNVTIPDLKAEAMVPFEVLGPDGKSFVSPFMPGATPGQWPMAGGFAFVSQLPPGTCHFTATHSDGRSWSGSATIIAGEITEVTLD